MSVFCTNSMQDTYHPYNYQEARSFYFNGYFIKFLCSFHWLSHPKIHSAPKAFPENYHEDFHNSFLNLEDFSLIFMYHLQA